MKPKDQIPLIRVLVADSLPVYRDGLILLLEKKHKNIKCTPAETGHEVLNLIRKQPFDILLLDEVMPGLSGNEVLDKLKKQQKPPRVVLIATRMQAELLKKIIAKEVGSVLCKDCTVEQIYEAICEVEKIGYHVPPDVAQQLLVENYKQELVASKPEEKVIVFDEKERRLIGYVMKEKTYAQIGVMEHASKRTIEEWTRKIRARLGYKYFREVVRYAIKTGQIKD